MAMRHYGIYCNIPEEVMKHHRITAYIYIYTHNYLCNFAKIILMSSFFQTTVNHIRPLVVHNTIEISHLKLQLTNSPYKV